MPRNVDVVEAPGASQYGGYALSRFENMDSYGSTYSTPGWKRAQSRAGNGGGGFSESKQSPFGAGRAQSQAARRGPMTIEGELVAKSSASSSFGRGERVFHVKFGPGSIYAVDGNKLTVDFDKAGRKMVLESFVQRG